MGSFMLNVSVSIKLMKKMDFGNICGTIKTLIFKLDFIDCMLILDHQEIKNGCW